YGTCSDITSGTKVLVSGLPGVRTVSQIINGHSTQVQVTVLVAADVTILDHPDRVVINGLRQIEIDPEAKVAYVGALWQVNSDRFQGLLEIDISRLQGGLIDQDNDGWDDRLLARVPIVGPGQPIPAGA